MEGAQDGLQQDRPLVSIGVPIYNEAEHLAETLDSLLAQDHRNIEVIICDNASTDGSAGICEAYAAKDQRVHFHSNEQNVGGIENFNRVFRLAQGEFFMWSSGHDLRHPAQLSRCLAVLQTDPEIVLCYTQVAWIEADGRLEEIHEYVDTRGLADWLPRLNVVLWGLHSGLPIYGVFRTEALKKTEVYSQVYSPDLSLLIELSVLGKFAFLPEPPFHLRRTSNHGDMQTYLAKHFDKKSAAGGGVLYWRMAWGLAQRVSRHVRTLPGKIFAALYVLVGTLINYRWILVRLRELGQKPDRQGGL